MPTIQDFVKWGLDREVPELLSAPPDNPLHLNLGPGDVKIIPGTLGVGRASNKLTERIWTAPRRLPFEDGTVGAVHAHHFLEHFDVVDVMRILDEIARVLAPGGVAFITTPLQGTSLQRRALDHLTEWNEETWEWIFHTTYYDDFPPPLGLRIHTVFIAGIVERNLCVFAQLVKAA